MHENRETPSPTVSESGSPAGEGESRTSGMHSSGESDGAVVPMKPSNKATGQAPGAAERVEGRAPTKENVQQARAVPAQHGAAASQGLKGVRKVAKERKQERFTTLLHHLTVNLLRDSYYALKREAAPGVDGVRWAEYEDGLEPRLKSLHEQVHHDSHAQRIQCVVRAPSRPESVTETPEILLIDRPLPTVRFLHINPP